MDTFRTVAARVLYSVFSSGPMSQAKLEAAWKVAVGDGLTRVTAVTWRPDGVVEVRADDERWAAEVRRSGPVILSRLQGLLGGAVVSALRVV